MVKFEQHFLDEIRDRVPISSIVARRVTFDKRKTNAGRGDYWFCCPVHSEKSPSAHCEDRKQRWKCFGCGAGGDHFRFLTEVDGMSFPEAVKEVAGLAGINMPDARPPTPQEIEERRQRAAKRDQEQAALRAAQERDLKERKVSAAILWKQAEPLAGTLAHDYFEWRCPGLAPGPEETELRFHPALEMDPDRPRGDKHPALLARVSDKAGKGIAVWRIYLQKNGQPLLDKQHKKIKLGYGPAAGGAVRLGGTGKTIGVCEGIETGRAIPELGVPYPVWPTLSTSGLIGFQIPDDIKTVIVYRDPDGSKVRFKTRRDGAEFISEPPGLKAMRTFIERNPDRDIRSADGAFNDDYLEVLQNMKGVPIR